MANEQAKKDENSVPELLGTVGATRATIRVLADPTTHALKVSDGTTGSDNGPANAPHDSNSIPALMATSSADGKTPVVVYADSSGNLLIKSS